ncbi:MAG: tRNA-binding protein [Candidatus Kariarchaeaceae archaeon]|jgi:tRNA-binding protein
MISFDDFLKVDMRVGRIINVEHFPKARNPSYKIQIDFGEELGTKWTSAQAKSDYTMEQLLGMDIIAVVNFPPKNIAGFMSEVLILGVATELGELSLLEPNNKPVKLGSRVH